ncbi:MAG: PKD domain-containing protein [Sterolibacteriaceae bacterium]|nr:PKD domain-containing protein [Candidatus Methylophosphatis haderslevensis]
MLHHFFRVKAATAFFAVLLLSLFAIPAFAGQASLAWNASASSGVTGYKVHYGTASRNYATHLDVGGALSATVPNLTAGTTYYFAVTAYNAAGESGYSNEATAAIPVAVAPPVAMFTAGPVTGTAPLNTTFTSSSTGSISTYAWSFGDGGSASTANTNHTYSSAGIYTVTLTVSGAGGTASASKTINVSAPIVVAKPNPNDLVIDFGANFGIWQRLNNTSWSGLYGGAPSKRIVVADLDHNGVADQIIDFGSAYGIWTRMNNAAWAPLIGLSSTWIVKADLDGNGQDGLVVDFGSSRGIYTYRNGSGFLPLNGLPSKQAIVADIDNNGRDDIVIDFGAYGVWAYMNGGVGSNPWQLIDARSPDWMSTAVLDASGQKSLVMSFGAGTGAAQSPPGKGVWAYAHLSKAWRQLDYRATASVRGIALDFDGNGQDDLVVDFGTNGLWRYVPGSAAPWVQLHALGSKSLTKADLDSNGQDDLVVDFGSPYGIYALINGKGGFTAIYGAPATAIAAGQIDGK